MGKCREMIKKLVGTCITCRISLYKQWSLACLHLQFWRTFMNLWHNLIQEMKMRSVNVMV